MSSNRREGPADVVPGDDEPGASADRRSVSPDKDSEESGSPAAAGARRRWWGGKRREPDGKKPSLLRELPVLLLVAFVLALLVKTFFVQAFFIPSGSMETTLHGCTGCTGDRILVNKVPYWFGDPEPGDIVVFEAPEWSDAPEVQVDEPSNRFSGALLWLGRAVGVAPPSDTDFVKRVIAVGGQTVQCCDDQGRVMVDGKPLDEPYIYQNTPLETRSFGPIVVPDGRLWVMGDHRSASADSRRHLDKNSGTISVDDVVGKASVIVWPLDRFGGLDSPDIQGAAALTGAPAVLVPHVLGLMGAVPLVAWRRRRRHRHRWARATRDDPE